MYTMKLSKRDCETDFETIVRDSGVVPNLD